MLTHSLLIVESIFYSILSKVFKGFKGGHLFLFDVMFSKVVEIFDLVGDIELPSPDLEKQEYWVNCRSDSNHSWGLKAPLLIKNNRA